MKTPDPVPTKKHEEETQETEMHEHSHGHEHHHEDGHEHSCRHEHHHEDEDRHEDGNCFHHEHHHKDEDEEDEHCCHHGHSRGHSHSHGLSCGCGHCHGHCDGEEEEPNRPVMIGRLITAAVLLIAGLFFPEHSPWRLALSLASALCVGYDVLIGAGKNLLRGEMLDELFLMSVAALGAFVLGEYSEGALVFLLFQLGEFLQDLAVDRSRASISDLMNIRPEAATVIRYGKEIRIHPEEVRPGEIVLVNPGERVPLDGIVTEGDSFLDTVALTGESVPRGVHAGDEILSGCVNLQGQLKIEVSRPYGESAVSRILELVENATEHKSRADRFMTRFARVYTPTVVGAAAALFLIAGLITGQWAEWFRRALTFLVISCPCALVISVPLTYFNGIGRASRKGILVKGSNILEELSRTSMVAFDKTGTVTEGVFEVVAIHPMDGTTEQELLQWAAGAERYSSHPIAEAIRSQAGMPDQDVREVQEIAGQGVTAVVGGHRIAAGNDRLMATVGAAEPKDCHLAGTIVHIAADGAYAGHLVIADRIKESAEQAVSELKKLGIRKTVMLTGDRRSAAEEMGRRTGVDEIQAELKPEEKVRHITRLMNEKKEAKETVVFVGDGINDAPVLATADLGVAMGAAGSDAAVEAADIVLIDDDPGKLAEGIRLARRTQRIVTENIVFSILIKVLVMILGAFGVVPLWLAVFSDVGVCLLAIMNAMR